MAGRESKKGSGRHARVERLSLFGLKIRMGPPSLFVYADHFLQAGKAMQPLESAPQFPLVKAYLVAHAVELALKAFLSLKGISLEELAGGAYGHDLENLIAVAERQGLQEIVVLTDRQRLEIVRTSAYYQEKVLEYPSLIEAVRAYPGMPNVEVLLEAGEALVASLREPCLRT